MRIANKYDIIDELGRGGMGRVYRVRHVQLNTVFALKTLLPQFAADASVVARFQHEARVVARLQHPNIVRVFDIDRDGDQYFIVMEYIAGQSLAERLKTKGPYAPAEALAIAGQVGAALAYAHARQPAVVHRDIKPSNIMIEDASGRVVVTDFGIAKILDPEQPGLTGTGMMVGSFRYCAPEQLEADPHLDARADIFSFGLVLYELLAGRPFFEGLSYSEVVRRQLYDPHEHAPVLPATTPAVWRAVIARAIAKDRERRYATVAELLGALQAAPPDSATRPQPESAPPALRRRVVLALGVHRAGDLALALRGSAAAFALHTLAQPCAGIRRAGDGGDQRRLLRYGQPGFGKRVAIRTSASIRCACGISSWAGGK
ncbi:MAG: serine/threonine-protein kinase [Gammaproteobacteria bacterium]